ncbi:MAG TPA: SOS response-associated peptidase [Jatrophihabitans sp.]|nr:SOS response-associated peptidase [Jatrophihabitans sp.]
MCGRYVSVKADEDLTEEFDAFDATDGSWLAPSYNLAPTDPVRVVVNRPLRDADGTPAKTPTRQLRVATWGLIPSWAKDRKTQSRMFNARAESVASTNAFRRAYAKRRCLVPADGWYEWQSTDGAPKQPVYMTRADGRSLAFAGLYEFWGEGGVTITSCTIITVPSAGALAEIHDRMPLVLPDRAWARWLDPKITDPAELLASWDEAHGEHLELRPVATLVNKVDNNGPELIERVEPQPEAQVLF